MELWYIQSWSFSWLYLGLPVQISSLVQALLPILNTSLSFILISIPIADEVQVASIDKHSNIVLQKRHQHFLVVPHPARIIGLRLLKVIIIILYQSAANIALTTLLQVFHVVTYCARIN